MTSWDETKRLSNLRDHGDGQMHVIPLRKAQPYEARYLEAAKEQFDKGRGP